MRRRWDQVCASAATAARAARESAAERQETWVVRWFTQEIDQLAMIQAMVNGKRLVPGTVASGLFRDFLPDLQAEPYAAAMSALSEVGRLGAPRWTPLAGTGRTAFRLVGRRRSRTGYGSTCPPTRPDAWIIRGHGERLKR